MGFGAEDRNRTGTIVEDRRILSPVRLPGPPLRHILMLSLVYNFIQKNKMEAAPRFELGVKDLQSSALPLGYAASKNGAEDEIRTRDIRLGKATLYH